MLSNVTGSAASPKYLRFRRVVTSHMSEMTTGTASAVRGCLRGFAATAGRPG
jgi:hypothetical protein